MFPTGSGIVIFSEAPSFGARILAAQAFLRADSRAKVRAIYIPEQPKAADETSMPKKV
jgi:hypothetical protein